MSKVENVSQQDIIEGKHLCPSSNKVHLIQICNEESEHVEPKYWKLFKSIRQYKFNDTEDCFDIDCITDVQAKNIAQSLKDILSREEDLVVHCNAGICRSGAVVACAEELGFEKCCNFKLPNSLVKRKIMQALGLGITKETSFNQLVVTTEE